MREQGSPSPWHRRIRRRPSRGLFNEIQRRNPAWIGSRVRRRGPAQPVEDQQSASDAVVGFCARQPTVTTRRCRPHQFLNVRIVLQRPAQRLQRADEHPLSPADWATDSPAACTPASATTPNTTNTPRGQTELQPPLDNLRTWDDYGPSGGGS